MKIYLVSTSKVDYDEYDSVVVSAESRKIAIDMAMNEYLYQLSDKKDLKIKYVGEYYCDKSEVILASYNAG